MREHVSVAEARLLLQVHPEGNTIPNPGPHASLNPSQVRPLLEAALSDSLAAMPVSRPPVPHGRRPKVRKLLAEPEDTGAEARFLDLIELAPAEVQDFFHCLTKTVAETRNAEVNYTFTPDLRIQSYGVQMKTFRNVVTLHWQPGKKRLLLRSLLPESQLKNHGMSIDRFGRMVLRHETFISLDFLRAHSDLLIKAILRAHELAQHEVVPDHRTGGYSDGLSPSR